MGVTPFPKGYGVFDKHHVTPASFYTLKFYAAQLGTLTQVKEEVIKETGKIFKNFEKNKRNLEPKAYKKMKEYIDKISQPPREQKDTKNP